MSKREKFTFLGNEYEFEVFGQDKVSVLNGDLVRGKVSGVAFDFDGTITGRPRGEEKLENYRVRPELISIIEELQKRNIAANILTSASWEWVEKKMREAGYIKVLTKLRTICQDDAGYKEEVEKLNDKIGNPYWVKIPTTVGCNIIVDDAFAHSESHGRFGKILKYCFIDVSKMGLGDEIHLREALVSLKAL